MNGKGGSLKGILLQLLSFVLIPLPSRLKIPIYRRVFGYQIGKHVKIGWSWIMVGKLKIGDYVIIGHFNRFKYVPEVSIGDYSAIADFNTFTSCAEFTNEAGMAHRGNRPRLVIGDHVGIAAFHLFDVQDEMTIGSFTTIAGKGSIFMTHYLEVMTAEQTAKPLRIGDYCMVGARVCFVPGSGVPDFSVVGMGAVVTKLFTESHCLIAGNPAKVNKKYPEDAPYFNRTEGFISSYASPPYRKRK